MNDNEIQAQAAQLECMLPKVFRRVFTLTHDHPATVLPLAQLRVCSILQGGARSLSALSEELAISLSAVTQLADRLERAGFVLRVVEGEDRRVRILALTERGAELMALRRDSRQRRAAEVLAKLSPEDREALLGILERMFAVVQDLSPDTDSEDATAAARAAT